MKKTNIFLAALFILIGGWKFLPVSAQTPGVDVQIDPNPTGSNPVGPGASMNALQPAPGQQAAISGGLKSQFPNSVVTSDVRRDVQILPKKGTLPPYASQAQLSGAVSDETSAGRALTNGRALSSGRNGAQTIPDMSRAAGQSAAGAREVKALEVDVQKLEDPREIPSESDAGALFHRMYDLDDVNRAKWTDPMAMYGIGLPKIHPKNLTADVERTIGLAAKVDPISAVGLLLGSVAEVKTLLEKKQITGAQASAELQRILGHTSQMALGNHGALVKRLVVAALDYADHAASGRHYEEMAAKASAELNALNVLESRKGRSFIKGEPSAQGAISRTLDAALAHPEVLPQMPIVESDTIGFGADAAVVLEVRADGDMPSVVREVSKEDLLKELALRDAETVEPQMLESLPEKGAAIINSAMPVKFWETSRKYWNQSRSFWVGVEIFGRWFRGERSDMWASILNFYYALLGRFSRGPDADIPTLRLRSDSLRGIFSDPRRSGLILQPV